MFCRVNLVQFYHVAACCKKCNYKTDNNWQMYHTEASGFKFYLYNINVENQFCITRVQIAVEKLTLSPSKALIYLTLR